MDKKTKILQNVQFWASLLASVFTIYLASITINDRAKQNAKDRLNS